MVGLISIGPAAWGMHPLLLLLIAGGAVILTDQMIRSSVRIEFAPLSILRSAVRWPKSLTAAISAASAAVAPLSLGSLFLVFLKFGAVIFGSGYVSVSYTHLDVYKRQRI